MRTPRIRRSQTGSAFVVVLMVLIVLTFIGLGLSLMTESEITIGWNERVATRMLYVADTGIAVSVARNDGSNVCSAFDMDPAAGMPGSDEAQLRVSPYLPVNISACNLCDIHIHDAAGGFEKAYERAVSFVGAEGVRSGPIQSGQSGFTSHVVSSMIEILPDQKSYRECVETADVSGRKLPTT